MVGDFLRRSGFYMWERGSLGGRYWCLHPYLRWGTGFTSRRDVPPESRSHGVPYPTPGRRSRSTTWKRETNKDEGSEDMSMIGSLVWGYLWRTYRGRNRNPLCWIVWEVGQDSIVPSVRDLWTQDCVYHLQWEEGSDVDVNQCTTSMRMSTSVPLFLCPLIFTLKCMVVSHTPMQLSCVFFTYKGITRSLSLSGNSGHSNHDYE